MNLHDMVAAAKEAKAGEAACDCAADTKEVLVTQTVFVDERRSFTVEVPAVLCVSCGESYTDERAEKIRHDAACRFEGLLAPDEVKAIRQRLGMTRREFDEAYGFAPASMQRWESGRLMQSRSADTLLRALSIPSVALTVDRRGIAGAAALQEENVIHVRFKRLRAQSAEVQAETLRRKGGFQLKRAG